MMSMQQSRSDICLSLVHPDDLEEVIDYFPGKKYYKYRGNKYHVTFPEEWALDYKFGTGYDCANCRSLARFRGVLYGYCDACAIDVYKGERGNGFHFLAYEKFDIDDPITNHEKDIIYSFPEKKFYIYRGKKFHIRFPVDWAKTQMPLTGHGCGDCITHGMFRNVLIGYCRNCAVHSYDRNRGDGFDCQFSQLEVLVEKSRSRNERRKLLWGASSAAMMRASYLGLDFVIQNVNPI
jgi:hypothetical protein